MHRLEQSHELLTQHIVQDTILRHANRIADDAYKGYTITRVTIPDIHTLLKDHSFLQEIKRLPIDSKDVVYSISIWNAMREESALQAQNLIGKLDPDDDSELRMELIEAYHRPDSPPKAPSKHRRVKKSTNPHYYPF